MKLRKIRAWKLIYFCDIDEYAIKSYCAIHGKDEKLNLGDIANVNETKLKDFNMMTWGFPCTDISCAGKQKGFLDENGNKTRSGMYYEGIRILRYKKPGLSIIENVKNLTSKRFKKEFEIVLNDLYDAGYNSYYKILNARDFGVPQNRERIFIVSIRKDLDNCKFVFPEGFENGIRLKDILEDEVDEKFYINSVKLSDGKMPKERFFRQAISTFENSNAEFGDTIDAFNQRVNKSGYSPTLTTRPEGFKTAILPVTKDLRIRKLTPKETFRLMGFSDSAYEAASNVVSKKQLYKQSGNSIVVDVLYYILIELYKAMPYLFNDLRLGSFFSGIGAFETSLDLLYKNHINSEE